MTLITPAAVLPVSLAAIKAHCGVEDSSQDVALEALRKAAHAHVATALDLALGAASWRLTLAEFAPEIELACAPVLEVSAVNYRDAAGTVQLAAPELYVLDLTARPARVLLNDGSSWPETMVAHNAVTVDFTAGWTDVTLPADLALAVTMLAAAWFDDRAAAVPAGVQRLLDPWRTIRI